MKTQKDAAMYTRPLTSPSLSRLLLTFALATTVGSVAWAQDDGSYEVPDTSRAPSFSPPTQNRSAGNAATFDDSLSILEAPASAPMAVPGASTEIFPDASKVWMTVRDTSPVPVETARRGGKWLCSNGGCTAKAGSLGRTRVGDAMLRSIKLQAPQQMVPLTLWGRSSANDGGRLYFDPQLLGRRSYAHVCAYRPTDSSEASGPPVKPGDKVPTCIDQTASMPSADSSEITLGLEWPHESELANFRYLAIVDSCGNARVQPFQRIFTVPVFEVASGGCGKADGKVLRIFPQGGSIRVSAFNLDSPAVGNVMNATYRVTVPPLENDVEANPPKMLFPDILQQDLQVDCGPGLRKAATDSSGAPPMPPAVPPVAMAPAAAGAPALPPSNRPSPSAANAPPERFAASEPSPPAPAPTPMMMPTPPAPRGTTASKAGPKPLTHQGLVIAPEPLRLGNCRIRLQGQTKGRLIAPLALYVRLTRTDTVGIDGAPIDLLQEATRTWIVTPSNPEFILPALNSNFDGDSRLRLTVSSDPLSSDGKVVLLSDAGRIAGALADRDSTDDRRSGARRMVGSATIHSVPLCGESNFETLEGAGSCLRAYLTIPAMIATIQVIRAPWVERPIVQRGLLSPSAIGIALAFDAYDPVARKAFPVAAQIGGFAQGLSENRYGLMGYVGLAPTLPVLGQGGNTTSLGFLTGLGLEYITNQNGPDEGIKPTAFVSFVVQVGQASPGASGKANSSFGASAESASLP